MNILVQIFGYIIVLLDIYSGVELLDHLTISCLSY